MRLTFYFLRKNHANVLRESECQSSSSVLLQLRLASSQVQLASMMPRFPGDEAGSIATNTHA